jgi:hypothetical protein
LLTYLPMAWRSRVTPVVYAEDGSELRSEDARLRNLLGRTPAWIIAPESRLQDYLQSSFGRDYMQRLTLRRLAEFPKPGLRTRLCLYEVGVHD